MIYMKKNGLSTIVGKTYNSAMIEKNAPLSKEGSKRSLSKDFNSGDTMLRGLLISTMFLIPSTNGFQSVSFQSIVQKLSSNTENAKKGLEMLNVNTSEKLEGVNHALVQVHDKLEITKSEMLSSEGFALTLNKISEATGLNVTPSNFYEMFMAVSVIGMAATGVYLKDKLNNNGLEEKISKYSDIDKRPEQKLSTLKNERIFEVLLNASTFGTLEGDTLFSSFTRGVLTLTEKVLNLSNKALKKLASTVLENDKEETLFEKSLTFLKKKIDKKRLQKWNESDKFANTNNLSAVLMRAKQSVNDTKSMNKNSKENLKDIKDTSYREKLKRDVRFSLELAIKNIEDPASKEKDKIKAVEILNDIIHLDKNTRTSTFNDYEAISKVAKDYFDKKSNGFKIKITSKETVKKYLQEKLDKESHNISFNNLIKANSKINALITEDFAKNLSELISDHEKTIFKGNFDTNILDVKIKVGILVESHLQNDSVELKEKVKLSINESIVKCFQDKEKLNIKDELVSYREMQEKMLKSNKKTLDKMETNGTSYALNNFS